ncbi:MAG: hypothetical protein A3J48_02360 [Candidatus Doudnabacteria bacterium RIFCSPHIGHO2_02_FULL_46_11]|uniref:Uncharacterized protein n=1 Tax=Candidatus Doudnabacteria bacterium RIFCSPHIGHO2_02_FULL_46_11 TaxID=1817832 RepID=A0A1F5P8V4_9BACT|nr:MAG: hypothetical protein A3J48_02360 [Candidatus Doudnabacteria bacterium RIFCSPHIGHO2_02_FULL_46_11]
MKWLKEKFNVDYTLKSVGILGIIIAIIALVYSFIVIPYVQQKKYRICFDILKNSSGAIENPELALTSEKGKIFLDICSKVVKYKK